jgi:hypothetical protein
MTAKRRSSWTLRRKLDRLAKLSRVTYEHERRTAAKRLGVRADSLDNLVKNERAEKQEKEPALQREPRDHRVEGSTPSVVVIDSEPHSAIASSFSSGTKKLIWAEKPSGPNCRSIFPWNGSRPRSKSR